MLTSGNIWTAHYHLQEATYQALLAGYREDHRDYHIGQCKESLSKAVAALADEPVTEKLEAAE